MRSWMTGARRASTARSRSGALAAIALTVTLLAGCASPEPPPELNTTTAAQLQESVLAVTQAAADGDIAGAIANLDALQTQLREATAAGSIDPDRSARIQAAIDLVRADLVAAMPPPPDPAPPADNSGNSGNGNGNEGEGSDGGNKGGDKGDKGGGKDKDKP